MKRRSIIFFRKGACLALFYLVLNHTVVFSQSDSLRAVISFMPEKNEKVDRMKELIINYYRAGNFDSTINLCLKSADLSARLGYQAGLAESWYLASLAYRKTSQYELSQDYLDRYLELVYAMQDSVRLAKGYFQQSNLLRDMGKNDLAMVYIKKSLFVYLPLKDTNAIISNYNGLGLLFQQKALYDSSASYYMKAIDLIETTDNKRNLALVYGNLGDTYFMAGEFALAERYYYLALEIFQDLPNNTIGLALSYNNLGRAAALQENYVEAIGFYDQALSYYRQTENKDGWLHVYNNYGDLFHRQGKYDLALGFYEKALAGYLELGYPRGIVTALNNKAMIYTEAGNFSRARKLLDSCLLLTYKYDTKELRLSVLGNISDLYIELGNFQKAFEFLQKATELKDSIYELSKDQMIADLNLKYEKQKDQARIRSLEYENLLKEVSLRKRTSQRNAFLVTVVGVVVIGTFIFLYLRQRSEKDKIIAEQRIRQLEEEKKLMGAKLLIEGQEEERKRIARELHDGLGVLLSATRMQFTSIKEISPESQPLIERAAQLLEQATGDVRKISHNMMPGLLTKLGLFEALEDLFENLNDAEDLHADCQINVEGEKRLPENREIMIYRIVQEMVNNSLKHSGAAHIKFMMTESGGKLSIIYSDDGKGFDLQQKLSDESASFGLKSIQSRVGFLNGEMNIKSSPGKGTEYTISFPV